METTVKQRLVQFIKFMHLTQKAFEERCGMGNGYVNSIRRSIGPEKMQDIIRAFPELNREWLLYGEGEMLRPSAQVVQNNVLGNNNYNYNTGTPAQPQHPVLPQSHNIEVECPNCGEVIEVTNAAVLPLVPPEVARAPNIDLESFRHNRPQEMDEVDLRQVWGKGVFLVKIDTRAMEPEYREGSYLVLRKLPGLAYARPDGSAYVIDTMLPHTLFRYLSKERDGTYKLSANRASNRDPLYLQAEDIQHIYDIVGSFRVGR